jgi:hypothetical protein
MVVIQQLPTGNAAGLSHFIYGKAASMTAGDAQLILYASLAIAFVCGALFKEFKMLCFDTAFAQAQGWPVLALDRIYARGADVLDVAAHDSAAARRASDHLPVVADFEIARLGIGLSELRERPVLSRSESGDYVLQRISAESDLTVEVFDATGRLIERERWPAAQLRWSPKHLARGWSMLQVQSPSGSTKFTVLK